MKAVLTVNNLEHQRQHAEWMAAGLKRHGWSVDFYSREATLPAADLAASWSVKHRAVWDWQKRNGEAPVLVMERAHLQPRHEFTSCGFNGLAGRGTYVKATDGGLRWRTHFAHQQKPWREPGEGYAIIFGQVKGDASLGGVDFRRWAHNRAVELRALGYRVFYRPHPLSARQHDFWRPSLAPIITGELADNLAGCSLAVTYNSTSAVEAVLAGVPAVACDQGSMAWPVATHSAPAEPIRPSRATWAHNLAWTSFLPTEIESGFAWDHLKGVMPCCA